MTTFCERCGKPKLDWQRFCGSHCSHLWESGDRKPPRKFTQVNDYETSTLKCVCGETFTWSGFDEKREPWLEQHRPHVDDMRPNFVTSEDGKRAEGG